MDSLLQPAFNELRTGFDKFEMELRKVVKGVLVGQGVFEILYIRLSLCVLMISLITLQSTHEKEGSSYHMPMLKDNMSEDINAA